MGDEAQERPVEDEGIKEQAGSDEEPEQKESAKWRDPKADLRALETILRRTGRDLQRPLILEGALWFLTTAIAIILVGLGLAAIIPEMGYTLGRWVMGLGLLSATVGAVTTLLLYLYRGPGPGQIAARLQRHSPELRSDLVAALEFGQALVEDGGEELRAQGFSEAMARVHLSKTVRRAHELARDYSLAYLVPKRELTPPLLALSGGVVLLFIPFLLNAGWTLGVLSGERLGTPIVGERVLERPIVSYLDGVFVFPAYTGVERQMMRLGGGSIDSLEGTEVHLRGVLTPGEWQELEMVVELEGEDEPQVTALAVEEHGQISVSLKLTKNGEYWFRGKTENGRPIEDKTTRTIRVVKDQVPRVRITSHSGQIAVQPEDLIELEFEATDDFGVDRVTVVHHFEGAPDSADRELLELPELANQPSAVQGGYKLDLQPLNLQPKDSLVLYFEARDNNTATGPGIGQSESLTLYVESPEDRHLENIERQQELMEALLMHLADFLEAPVGERELQGDGTYRQLVTGELSSARRVDLYQQTRELHRQREGILREMSDLLSVLEEDPLMVGRILTLFEGLLKRLEVLQTDGDELFARHLARVERADLTIQHIQAVADYAARSERELEKGILSLEELLISQKMDLLETTAQDIEELRQRLKELLEQYRDSQDLELKEAILREIQRLRQRMAELMERMQMQLQVMPQEHVNLEALEQMQMESEAKQMSDQLRSIEEMLEKGDIDGALAMLDQMEMSLDSLTSDMRDSFEQMEPQGLSELDQAVGEMMDEVNQLADMERAIEERTRELQEQIRQERQEEIEKMLAPLLDELLKEVAAQEKALEKMEERSLPPRDELSARRTKDRNEELKQALEHQDLGQALEQARQAQNAARSLRGTLSLSERYTPGESEEGQAIRRSRQESEEVVQRADKIAERIEEFIEQAQQNLGEREEERFEELQEQQQQVNERAQELGRRISEEGERYPALEQQLREPMEAANEAMSTAEEALGERRAQQALDSERKAIEQLGQLQESMSQALERQRQQDRQESGQQTSKEQVTIPGEDDGARRERLRREMMEGMREGRPSGYESQIERYFRSLVE